MAALGEQQPHLLPGHHIPDVEAVDAGQPAADPPARRLTTLRVVAGQIRPAPMRRIQRRHLTDQIVIAVAGRQLVQAHRHTNQRRHEDARRSRTPHPVHQVCSVALFEGSGVAALVEENRGRSATSTHKGAGEPIEVYDAGMGP